MSIERLTKAARAAGYAMALNDEPVPTATKAIALLPASPVPGAAMLLTTPVKATNANPATDWMSPWKQWAAGAMPRIGA